MGLILIVVMKLFKKNILFCILLFFIFVSKAYTSGLIETSKEKVVNVYSHRHYKVDKELYDTFSKKTGIKINLIDGSAGEIVERIIAEGKNSEADLVFIVDIGHLTLLKKKKLLQKIPASATKNIPSNLQDPDREWVSVSTRSRIIVYDKTRIKNPTVTSYEDIVESPVSIAIRSSSNSYNQALLASIIYNNGEEKARKWVQNLVKHLARPPQGNDRSQAKAVVAGLADYAIMNMYYIGLLINSNDPKEKIVGEKLGIIFPNQNKKGTHINISGIGLLRNAPNKKEAIQLITFLLSKEAQKKITNMNFEYPASSEVSPTALLKNWGKFISDIPDDLNKIGELIPLAAKIADEEGWK